MHTVGDVELHSFSLLSLSLFSTRSLVSFERFLFLSWGLFFLSLQYFTCMCLYWLGTQIFQQFRGKFENSLGSLIHVILGYILSISREFTSLKWSRSCQFFFLQLNQDCSRKNIKHPPPLPNKIFILYTSLIVLALHCYFGPCCYCTKTITMTSITHSYTNFTLSFLGILTQLDDCPWKQFGAHSTTLSVSFDDETS